MSEMQKANLAEAAELALMHNDLSSLSTEERLAYYRRLCESLGLNPLSQPFAYLRLQGRTMLYAKKDCTDQLRRLHGVSIKITEQKTAQGMAIVRALATDKGGRTDEDTGVVVVAGLKPDALANALMKAVTKAKRRVTLSICGLGILDEAELDTMPQDAVVIQADKVPEPSTKEREPEIIAPPPEKTTEAPSKSNGSTGPAVPLPPVLNTSIQEKLKARLK